MRTQKCSRYFSRRSSANVADTVLSPAALSQFGTMSMLCAAMSRASTALATSSAVSIAIQWSEHLFNNSEACPPAAMNLT